MENAKTCVKALGLSEKQLNGLADLIESAMIAKDSSETKIRDSVITYLK